MSLLTLTPNSRISLKYNRQTQYELSNQNMYLHVFLTCSFVCEYDTYSFPVLLRFNLIQLKQI